ncbi:DNA mismatch endonuclease Vsr [Chryseolinea soli]|uniref:Very short patch repair endonuclease n=2 Tax=Chryseolinea soli TaxID=2321403 RepID=A0A385SM10_9BACT|nr:DNA mismatch endonuclease Vsr [Chryseolinea soli]
MDTVTKEKRSWMMSRVGPKNTAPERILSRLLRKNKIRYRKHLKSLPGTPDFTLSELRTVIFVHGCFWHGHKNCKYYKLPDTNSVFWKQKVEANRLRDRTKSRVLKKAGWRVVTVWQCQLRKSEFLDKLFTKLTSE